MSAGRNCSDFVSGSDKAEIRGKLCDVTFAECVCP